MTAMFEVTADSYLLGELVAREGEIVYRFTGATYGCIDDANGIACSRGGPMSHPFFEVPRRNLQPWTEETP